jgi:hypothetical protein
MQRGGLGCREVLRATTIDLPRILHRGDDGPTLFRGIGLR